MLIPILLVVALAIWAIVAVIGFVFKGLLWLAVIGIVLFLATAVISVIRGRAAARR